MVQEKLRREDSVETEKWNLLFGLFVMGINSSQVVRFRHKGGNKNISAIIEIYRLTDKTDNDSNLIKEGVPKFWHTLFITINEYHVS